MLITDWRTNKNCALVRLCQAFYTNFANIVIACAHNGLNVRAPCCFVLLSKLPICASPYNNARAVHTYSNLSIPKHTAWRQLNAMENKIPTPSVYGEDRNQRAFALVLCKEHKLVGILWNKINSCLCDQLLVCCVSSRYSHPVPDRNKMKHCIEHWRKHHTLSVEKPEIFRGSWPTKMEVQIASFNWCVAIYFSRTQWNTILQNG